MKSTSHDQWETSPKRKKKFNGEDLDNFLVFLIDTRLNKDDHDSTIESFKDEIKAEAEEGKLLRY